MNNKKNNELWLIFHGRFPSEKAAALFAAKNSESFALQNIETHIVVPRRSRRVNEDVFKFFNVRDIFYVHFVPVLDLFSWSIKKTFLRIAFSVSFFTFSLTSLIFILNKASKSSIIYSNEWMPLLFLSFFFKNTVYEMHDFPESGFIFFKFFTNRVNKLVIHNNWKAREACKLFNISPDKVLVESNAVSISDFDVSLSKEEAREKLFLPKNEKIVVYTGHLYRWKGVHCLADSGEFLERGIVIYFVGGTPKDVDLFKEKYGDKENIKIIGYRPHHEMPLWQKAADVLVLPNSEREKISSHYTSPMKLFEYMASRRPIVASDIPSVREVVGETEVFFSKPDDPKSLSQTISTALENNKNDKIISSFTLVSEHTWDKRASRIIKFILSKKI